MCDRLPRNTRMASGCLPARRPSYCVSNELCVRCRYPFNDTEHASLFAKISRGHYVMPDWLSPRARCLIRSLLRRDPAERLTAQDVLRHPWLSEHEERTDSGDQADQLVPDIM